MVSSTCLNCRGSTLITPPEVVQVGDEVTVEVLEVDMDREARVAVPQVHQRRPMAALCTHARDQTKLCQARSPSWFHLEHSCVSMNGIEGLVHISELAEGVILKCQNRSFRSTNDIFVRVIDIDLERRRISLSLKQANDSSDSQAVEEFDPYLYGMAPAFDEAGNYTGPEGFDPETGEWKGGFEEQRTEWEREYAEAHARWEAHRKQMTEAKEADQAAAVESGDASAYSSESATSEGTLR